MARSNVRLATLVALISFCVYTLLLFAHNHERDTGKPIPCEDYFTIGTMVAYLAALPLAIEADGERGALVVTLCFIVACFLVLFGMIAAGAGYIVMKAYDMVETQRLVGELRQEFETAAASVVCGAMGRAPA